MSDERDTSTTLEAPALERTSMTTSPAGDDAAIVAALGLSGRDIEIDRCPDRPTLVLEFDGAHPPRILGIAVHSPSGWDLGCRRCQDPIDLAAGGVCRPCRDDLAHQETLAGYPQ